MTAYHGCYKELWTPSTFKSHAQSCNFFHTSSYKNGIYRESLNMWTHVESFIDIDSISCSYSLILPQNRLQTKNIILLSLFYIHNVTPSISHLWFLGTLQPVINVYVILQQHKNNTRGPTLWDIALSWWWVGLVDKVKFMGSLSMATWGMVCRWSQLDNKPCVYK